MPFDAIQIDRECHTEWSKSNRRRNISQSSYVESKKKKKTDTKELTYITEKDSENKPRVAGKRGKLGIFGRSCTHCYI